VKGEVSEMDSKKKAEILKGVILSRYKSIRQFAVEMNIPYSTLITALERGVDGMAYSTVIKICEALSLNPLDFSPLEEGNSVSSQITTRKVMDSYWKLNKAGRKRILEIMDDYTRIPEYREVND
jgi:predicted transcriptional regulator